jgi:hypothetical protein
MPLCSSADETHDAMINVYLNRFGEKVETVTTQTLLDSWPGGSRELELAILSAANSPAGRNRQRTAHPADMFEGVLQELTDKFGGATSLLHVSGQGL